VAGNIAVNGKSIGGKRSILLSKQASEVVMQYIPYEKTKVLEWLMMAQLKTASSGHYSKD
jgi:hypothetical protein